MQPEPARIIPFVARPAPDQPVFVAGPDRSGTTLMFALLASHPDISMVRRTNMFRYFYERYGDLSRPENLDRCLQDMTRYRRMRHLQPDADRIRREFLDGPPTYGRLFALFHAHHAERAGRPRWGDKSLHTEHHADEVFTAFPDARVVHMVRDPRDRYASVRKRHGADLSRVGAATARWLMSTRAGSRNAARYPDRYLLVRYEDLVREPEATTRRVCDHIGVRFTPEMLTMDGAPSHRDTGGNSSFGDLEPGAISVRAVGRFRNVLAPGDLTFIDIFAGRALARLGYERARGDLRAAQRVRFVAWELPVGAARMLGWMLFTRAELWRGERLSPARLERERGTVHA
jgi:sulfotransferase family protein